METTFRLWVAVLQLQHDFQVVRTLGTAEQVTGQVLGGLGVQERARWLQTQFLRKLERQRGKKGKTRFLLGAAVLQLQHDFRVVRTLRTVEEMTGQVLGVQGRAR